MLDVILVESAMGHGANYLALSLNSVQEIFKPSSDFWEEYQASRGLTLLHEVLLRVKCNFPNIDDFLNHQLGLAPELIEARDTLGRTALHWAVMHAWTDATAILIKFGANVNQQVWTLTGQSTLLHLALAGPVDRSSKFLDIVHMLVCAGADVNAADHEGWTPLYIAASWNSPASVSRLRQSAEQTGQGINWEARTMQGKSACILAQESGAAPDFIASLASSDWSFLP
ncbi:ankyrin repeat-containing domain protein [Astrocystis sublimbata]|nr:ankyrin repeat-containing domain protein [Astrocystis sublimbata]